MPKCYGFGLDEDESIVIRARNSFLLLLGCMLDDLPGDPDNPSAIAPGLTIEGAVRAILNHIASEYHRLDLDDLAMLLLNLRESTKKTRYLERLSLFFVVRN